MKVARRRSIARVLVILVIAAVTAAGMDVADAAAVVVATGPVVTTTVLTSGPNPAYLDQLVTLTVAVTPAPAEAGQAAIYDDFDSVSDARYFIPIAAGTGIGAATPPPGAVIYASRTNR